MKIALAFFGQPRFVDNEEVISTYKEAILNKYDTDVFAHMWWKETNGEYEYSSWSKIDKCPISKEAPNIFTENYSPTILKIEEPKQFVLPVNVKKFVDETFVNNGNPHWTDKNFSNIMSQMYSIKSVADVVDSYIKKTNTNYDFIVLARYDAVLIDFPNLETCDNTKFYLPGHHPRFPDTIQFFGTRYLTWALNVFDDIGDIYKGIWEPSPEAFKMLSFLKWFDISDLSPYPMDARCIRN